MERKECFTRKRIGRQSLESQYAEVQRQIREQAGEIDVALDLVDMLKEHLALQAAEAALRGEPCPKWLFTSPRGGIIRSNNYRTIHATRHIFATRLEPVLK